MGRPNKKPGVRFDALAAKIRDILDNGLTILALGRTQAGRCSPRVRFHRDFQIVRTFQNLIAFPARRQQRRLHTEIIDLLL
jgi:hypothetical protein